MNKKNIMEWLQSLIEALIIAGILFVFFWPLKIEGTSMENTFFTGDRVIMSRALVYAGKFERGDLLVCKIKKDGEDKNIIKRLIGLPGDHIEIKDGYVYLNGTPLQEDYLKEEETIGDEDIILAEDEYYVLGDNRAVSLDSREEGPLNRRQLIGKVLLRWFPFGDR